MKLKTIFFLTILLWSFVGMSQNLLSDTINHDAHHHTPWDILSGEGDDSIVCYKQAHRNMYFVVTGLIILIALAAIKLLMMNRKTNKLLNNKNEIIEEKNKSITDSINYARRIQMAQLTPERYIERELNRLQAKFRV